MTNISDRLASLKKEAATIGLDYNNAVDITENDIRREHGLPLRGAYGN